jgi:hypothetical protein
MAPTQEIAQQPQAQETMTEPQANGVITEQPVCIFRPLAAVLTLQATFTNNDCVSSETHWENDTWFRVAYARRRSCRRLVSIVFLPLLIPRFLQDGCHKLATLFNWTGLICFTYVASRPFVLLRFARDAANAAARQPVPRYYLCGKCRR